MHFYEGYFNRETRSFKINLIDEALITAATASSAAPTTPSPEASATPPGTGGKPKTPLPGRRGAFVTDIPAKSVEEITAILTMLKREAAILSLKNRSIGLTRTAAGESA